MMAGIRVRHSRGSGKVGKEVLEALQKTYSALRFRYESCLTQHTSDSDVEALHTEGRAGGRRF